MKIAVATLESLTPYSQSRHYDVPKLDREIPKAYEERTWRERCHVNSDGFVFIPPMAFKNTLSDAAKYLSLSVKGKGKATYTKNFEAGVMVTQPLVLPIKKEDVEGEWLFVPSDGVRGSGKRVDKCFPVIPKWRGDVEFIILDDVIDPEVFETVLEGAGKFIGIGRFRPRNNGFYGRFKYTNILWG